MAYTKLYGWGKKNERITEGVIDCRFQRKSVLSTIRISGEMCPIIFNGTLNKERFTEYIKKDLAPTLNSDDVLLLDNSSVHHSKLVIEALSECNIKYLFLPPYSPDFNPIELLWSWMKSYLKKEKARTHDKLENAIHSILSTLSNDIIYNWFHHCKLVN